MKPVHILIVLLAAMLVVVAGIGMFIAVAVIQMILMPDLNQLGLLIYYGVFAALYLYIIAYTALRSRRH